MKTLNEYDKYDQKVLNENFNELKSGLDQVGQVKNGFGLLSSDLCTIYGSVSVQKLSEGICNIFIKAKIESRSEDVPSETSVAMFDVSKILALVNLKSINWNTIQTMLYIDQRGMTSGLLGPQHVGYGFGVQLNNGIIRLGRIWKNTGEFGPYAGNSPYYTPGNVYYISIFGATYT